MPNAHSPCSYGRRHHGSFTVACPVGFRFIVAVAFVFAGCSANLPPSFTRDMNNLVLSENTPVGEVVFTLQGTDPENSTVKYGIDGTDLLKVDADTGELTVAKPLDHEINDTLNFFVTIEDEIQDAPVGGNNVVQVPVTVIVLDENDNVPKFRGAPYTVSIKEDTPVGSMVFSGIQATDADTVGHSIEVDCVTLPDAEDACSVFNVMINSSAQSVYHGSLVLKSKLNYTKQQTYKFLLRATDGKLDSTTMVSVEVEDVQDTPPIFRSPSLVEISEDAQINTLALTVHAEDGDRGAPRQIVYELLNDPANYFLLDSTTGELRTGRPLDREAILNQEGKLTIGVKAIEIWDGGARRGNDSQTVAETNVTIIIKDVNDEPPVFNRNEYFAEISEDVKAGSSLSNLNMVVTDSDTGNNSVFALRLNDISHAFTVEPKNVTGSSQVQIRIAENYLDYEDPNQRKFIILVIAEEIHTDPRLSSTATVTVSVTDANDNAPIFERQSYTAVVSETAPVATSVTTVLAKDRDSGRFGDAGIVYKLVGEGTEKFTIDNRTGTVTVGKCDRLGSPECLDFETKREYLLSVKAIDDDGKGQTTAVPLVISLSDSNDNPPKFNQPIYNFYVDEDAVKFEPDLVISAQDADTSSHLSYSIVAGDDDGTFNVDPNTGKIRLATDKPLKYNRDTSKNSIVLTVEATDGKFAAATFVNITIKDVNDHPPIFDQDSYVVMVPEDVGIGFRVSQVRATDLDDGSNAQVEYSIKKGASDDFVIDNVTGVIAVASKLDYDRRNTYNIEVIAGDRGSPSLTGTTTVTVQVLNVNNKPPYFAPETQRAELMKDAKIGTVVLTLVAFDPDVNSSTALNFAAAEPITALDRHGRPVTNESYKDFFSVDKSTGKVYVANDLRRDVAAIVTITVLVTDTTAPTVQQGEGKLVVTILDINDRPPKFLPPWTPETPQYNLELQEELPVGTIVERYTATDEDSNIAGYYIIPESKYFEINNGTGILQVKRRIDYERVEDFDFTVFAFDSGVPQLNASARVRVTVLNTNDNSPMFAQSVYEAAIKENAAESTHIITVSAKDEDADEYGVVSYALSGEHSRYFVVNSTTGEILVANSSFFDREVINETTVEVVASDGAPVNTRRSATASVHVSILDVNDNPPRFNSSVYEVAVSEVVQFNPPFPVLQVWAEDVDEGSYGSIRYKIVSGNKDDVFLLSEDTGALYVHKSLRGKANDYVLEMEARDESGGGRFADRCEVRVHVSSVNQHRPNFVVPALPNATVEITETDVVGPDYLIMTVKATDGDDGENGRISYFLRINGTVDLQETNEFMVDPTTGELKSKVLLDPRAKRKYELVLVAKDHGLTTQYETVRHMTVLLVNKNGSGTEFVKLEGPEPYHFHVPENQPKNFFVGRVSSDRDDDNLHVYYYYLISCNENCAFYIDKLGGKLYTNKMLDREETDEYDLWVEASNDADLYLTVQDQDRLLRNRSALTNVKVTVTDLNDNSPEFEAPVYYAAVNSLAEPGRLVTNVLASDPDHGVNGSFVYYVKMSNLYKYGSTVSSGSVIPSPFNVTANGSLYADGPLLENNQCRFVVDVAAKEVVFPEREGLAKVHVWVFEPDQLIRIILSRPVDEVAKQKAEIVAELSNATGYLVIVDEIKAHVRHGSHKTNTDWSDVYVLMVDPKRLAIVPVYDTLKVIDAKYDFLKDYYAGFAIENVVPAFAMEPENAFDPALSALIALLLVLFVGTVTFVVVCCCLRNWNVSRSKKKDALINKAIIDDLNTTENPLWMEQKLKIYEEQELSMQVFNEPEQAVLERRHKAGVVEYGPDDDTYATIQHPSHRGSAHVGVVPSLADDLADYATLSGVPHFDDRPSNFYETAMGFQGSTFQVPRPAGDEVDSQEECHRDAQLTVNNEGQLEYVAELI